MKELIDNAHHQVEGRPCQRPLEKYDEDAMIEMPHQSTEKESNNLSTEPQRIEEPICAYVVYWRVFNVSALI